MDGRDYNNYKIAFNTLEKYNDIDFSKLESPSASPVFDEVLTKHYNGQETVHVLKSNDPRLVHAWILSFFLVSGKTKAPYLWHLRLPIQQTPSKQSQQRPREKLVYNFVRRGLQAECDFALVINLCFHQFGIRSFLAKMWRLSSNWRHPVDAANRGIFRFPGNT